MVVGRGHRHDLLGADHRADVREPRRIGDRAGRDDRALAGHQPRHRGDRADPAGVRQRDVGALQVVGRQRVRARLLDQRVVRGEEVGERHPPGVADHRHHQRARAVFLLDVDRQADVDLSVVHAMRLAVDLDEVVGHHRHVFGRARDRVGDQVRERDLAPGRLQLLAPAVERRHGERAEARRRRDRARLLHVARERRRAALHQFRLGARAGAVARRRLGARRAVAGRREHVGLRDPPGRPAAGDARQIDALDRRRARRDRRDLRAVGYRRGRGAGRAPARPSRRAAGAESASPTRIRAITWPTVTVSPSATSSSLIVPLAGAGSSTSTLSVEISTIVSLALMKSPTCARHSRIVPSVTDSPAAGVSTSTSLPLAGCAPVASPSAVAAAPSAVPLPAPFASAGGVLSRLASAACAAGAAAVARRRRRSSRLRRSARSPGRP